MHQFRHLPSQFSFIVLAAVPIALTGCNTGKIGGDPIAIETPSLAPVITKEAPPTEEKDFGIPIYPKAEVMKEADSVRAVSSDYGVKMGVFTTTDTPEKVMEFYKQKYPHSPANSPVMSRHVSWSRKSENGKKIITCMISNPNAGTAMKSVRLTESKTGTEITLTRIAADKTKEEIYKPTAPSTTVPESGDAQSSYPPPVH